MGMALGGAGTQKADINVTPLVDVLLVLLIIFMVITPLTPKGLDALVPQPPKDKKEQPETGSNRRRASVGADTRRRQALAEDQSGRRDVGKPGRPLGRHLQNPR